MQFRWYQYTIYPITMLALALALALVAAGATVATIIIAMANPLRSIKNFLIAITAIAIIAISVSWHYYTTEISLAGRAVSVTVTKDTSFSKLTESLTSSGAIENPRFFKICARIRGIDKRLHVGRYDFNGNVSLRSILDALSSGKVAMTAVTIPEGLRIEQIAGILAGAFEFDSTSIVRVAYDTLLNQERYQIPNLEGYLLPETHNFPMGVTQKEVLQKLVSDTREIISEAKKVNENTSLSEYELITLASIIEAEARIQSEQSLISGVYHNRLKRGMLMQADPTVRYGLRVFKRKLYYKDLDKNTPYNTYMYKGLPPGPINSPGKAAILAAFNPTESDYLYFVADGTGAHVFSKTLREHNKANQKAKSERKK